MIDFSSKGISYSDGTEAIFMKPHQFDDLGAMTLIISTDKKTLCIGIKQRHA